MKVKYFLKQIKNEGICGKLTYLERIIKRSSIFIAKENKNNTSDLHEEKNRIIGVSEGKINTFFLFLIDQAVQNNNSDTIVNGYSLL